MILWRVLPHDPAAKPTALGGALCFPRTLQGSGRHDNPVHYGTLYVATDPVAAVAETLAQFRGTGPAVDAMLIKSGRRLALAELDLDDAAPLIDLDDPTVLMRESLRPSQVATTRMRAKTQVLALRLHEAYPDTVGLRWWSTLESSWINVTLFDRAEPRLGVTHVAPLTLDDDHVRRAAAFLGLG